uniref:Uncharacterized protein n=1 Tax=Mus musculus TaxID=10090 RepID=Q9D501_MOUSE|nr:unnamed protein product [Mus musculus]
MTGLRTVTRERNNSQRWARRARRMLNADKHQPHLKPNLTWNSNKKGCQQGGETPPPQHTSPTEIVRANAFHKSRGTAAPLHLPPSHRASVVRSVRDSGGHVGSTDANKCMAESTLSSQMEWSTE